MNIKVVETKAEKDQAFHVRNIVFVDEQNVPPEIEVDEHDDTAIHFIGYEDGEPIAAGRMRWVDEYGKLERICVLKEHRGKNYGKEMILFIEDIIQDKGNKKAKLNAQKHAEGFYKSLGYKTVSGEFMDAGIPHVTMVKELD
ncbi:GNAT family N-acetyltransferase [Oceanobacillus halotolerans]|uniref:GNAT family N-acetyltransferase n=1 Tax=Oceanobacillus halotolerans TaxID=2663380 RepID=UPI0013DAE4F7|nr:GNAT family N-acetyltransferase [Oceanobacillus halotolerans]